jgi:hypothetical protein
MNPYAKGLSNAVLGQSAPTSAGKVSTHFNSPYMKAISQNLMTAIYGSPQDELTRQQIAASKLSMQQTQAEMDTSAAQGIASTKLGDMLGSPASYDDKGNLKPEARQAMSQLNIAAGGQLGDFFTFTGDHQRTIASQNNAGDIAATAAETGHGYDVGMAELNHDLDKALANLNHSNTMGRDEQLDSYMTTRDSRLHGYGIEDAMLGASNNLYRDARNNEFTAGQNDLDRQLDRTQSAVDAVLENQTDPSQVGSIAEIFGVPMGTDLTESLSGIQPNPTGIKPNEFITLLDTSSELLWKNLGLDYNNAQHKEAFGPISQKLAALLQGNPNDATEIIARLQSQARLDDGDLVFDGGDVESWGMKEVK